MQLAGVLPFLPYLVSITPPPLFFGSHFPLHSSFWFYTFSDLDDLFLHPSVFFSQLNKVLFPHFTFLSRKISYVLSFLLVHRKTFFLYIFDSFHWMFKPEFLKRGK